MTEIDFIVKEYNAKDLYKKHIFTSEIALILCTKGAAKISINDQSYNISSGMNFSIRREEYLFFASCSDDLNIVAIEYMAEFFVFILQIIEKNVITTLLKHNAPNTCSTEMLKAANASIMKIVDLYHNTKHRNRRRYLVSLTVSLCFERYEAIVNTLGIDEPPIMKKQMAYEVVKNFRILCEKDHMRERNIKVYADQLRISTRHLYDLVIKSTGTSPKQILTEQIIVTSKRLLLEKTLTIKDISFMLNFESQSNFSQYFKSNTGETPTEFRKKYKHH